MKIFKKLMKAYKKSTIWFKLIALLVGLLIITILVNKITPLNEGFTQKEKFVLKTNDNLYDSFTAEIYDDLMFDSAKNAYEIREITKLTKLKQYMKFSIISDAFQQMEATTKRLELTDILVKLIQEIPEDVIAKAIYLIQGKLRPNFEGVELGIAEKLVMRAMSKSSGIPLKKIEDDYNKGA